MESKDTKSKSTSTSTSKKTSTSKASVRSSPKTLRDVIKTSHTVRRTGWLGSLEDDKLELREQIPYHVVRDELKTYYICISNSSGDDILDEEIFGSGANEVDAIDDFREQLKVFYSKSHSDARRYVRKKVSKPAPIKYIDRIGVAS